MSNPLRIAIVGCGGMGGGHAIAIASGSGNAVWNSNEDDAKRGGTHDTDISKKLVLAGTYDIAEDRQKWAQEHGYHTFASFEEILADDTVDAP